MSDDERPFERERSPQIDFIRLQLLNTLNQLRLEIMLHKTEHRKRIQEMLSILQRKDINNDVTFEVVSIRDRVDYLLESAKNLLRDPNDKENLEYKRFESLVVSILGIKLIKKKKLGLQAKRL